MLVNPTHTRVGNLRPTRESPDVKACTPKPYGAEPGGALTTYGVKATAAVANATG